MRASLSFRHGVHPPDLKELTAAIPIRRMPFPDEVVLPLRQHAGNPARPVVRADPPREEGRLVARGVDRLGEAVRGPVVDDADDVAARALESSGTPGQTDRATGRVVVPR